MYYYYYIKEEGNLINKYLQYPYLALKNKQIMTLGNELMSYRESYNLKV